jgi:hypothetical protein
VLVNFSGNGLLDSLHGKAVALDIRDRHAPFPSLFIIHEMRVRGFHPFEPVSPDIADDVRWQDWILSSGVLRADGGSHYFEREERPRDGRDSVFEQPEPQLLPMNPTNAPSGSRGLALNNDVIAEILAATRAMPSWKACEMEGMSWDGTAEENIKKYISSIGVGEDSCS